MIDKNSKDRLRFDIALNIQDKTPEEQATHIYTMVTAKKMLLYGGYLSQEEADELQFRIDAAIQKHYIQINEKDLNKMRIIRLPFE